MTPEKPIPSTYDGLVEALRVLTTKWTAVADRMESEVDHYPGGEWRVAVRRDDAAEIEALLPPPLVVFAPGERVWCARAGLWAEVLGGPWDDRGDATYAVRWDDPSTVLDGTVNLVAGDGLTAEADVPAGAAGECEWCVRRRGDRYCPSERADEDLAIVCTRPNGHDGEHVACGGGDHNLARWPQDDPAPVREGES